MFQLPRCGIACAEVAVGSYHAAERDQLPYSRSATPPLMISGLWDVLQKLFSAGALYEDAPASYSPTTFLGLNRENRVHSRN